MKRISWPLAGVGVAALAVAGAGVGLGWVMGSRGGSSPDIAGAVPRAAPRTAVVADTATPPASRLPSDGPDVALPLPSAPYLAATAEGGTGSVLVPPPMPSSGPTGVAAAAEQSLRMKRLQALSERLERMRQSGRLDMTEMDKILADLEKAWGSSEIAGVRIDVIRKNMETANQALRLNEDIERLRSRKDLSDEDRRAIDAKQKELMEVARRIGAAHGAVVPAQDGSPTAGVQP